MIRELLAQAAPALLACAALLTLVVTALPARAAHPAGGTALIGTWGAWRAVTHGAADRMVCYAYAKPESSTPVIPGRSTVVLTVTERFGAPRDAVALSAGFAFAPGAEVTVTAANARLRFYTAARSAFARSGRRATAAFDAADRATARSPAPRGRAVTDVFSLRGFGDAHRAIEKACPAHAA